MTDMTTSSKKRWSWGCGGCVLILLVIPILYYGAYLLMRGARPENPQLIAHRGGTVAAPENTLAAFENAIRQGADWLEFDVQRTSDGVLVVFHDETVDRTTDGSGRLTDLTFEQVRALDAGNGERVPTFDEVISLARSAEVGIMPEAKFPERLPGLATEMLTALETQGYLPGAIVQSFPVDPLAEIRAANSRAQVCRLTGLWVLSLSDLQPADAQFACPMAEMLILNPWMIRQAHQDGRKVYPFFGMIEHPLTMRLLLLLGVDGLMVDDPAALKAILD